MPKGQATEKTYLQRALNERGWSRSTFTAVLNRSLPAGVDPIPENSVVKYCEGKMIPAVERRELMERVLSENPVAGGFDLQYLWAQYQG